MLPDFFDCFAIAEVWTLIEMPELCAKIFEPLHGPTFLMTNRSIPSREEEESDLGHGLSIPIPVHGCSGPPMSNSASCDAITPPCLNCSPITRIADKYRL